MQTLPPEGLAHRLGEGRRSGRIVRTIQDHRWLERGDLEPTRALHGGQPLAQRVVVQRLAGERLDRDDPGGRVVHGVVAEQRQVEVLVRRVEPAETERLSADGEQAFLDLPVLALPAGRAADLGGTPRQDRCRGGFLLPDTPPWRPP